MCLWKSFLDTALMWEYLCTGANTRFINVSTLYINRH